MSALPARTHIPLRTCVVCRQRSAKFALMRYVRIDGELHQDVQQKLPGRGVYICGKPHCEAKLPHMRLRPKGVKA